MSDEVILYDLIAKDGRAWSPNTFKTRMMLNYKGIPYTTRFLHLNEVNDTVKALGVAGAPGDTHPYTVPTARVAGKWVMDSRDIAVALEELNVSPAVKLDSPYEAKLMAALRTVSGPLRPVWMPNVPKAFIVEGSDEWVYYYANREAFMGMPVDKIAEAGGVAEGKPWAEAKGGILEFAALLKEHPEGPFFEGKTPIFADFRAVSLLHFMKRLEEMSPGCTIYSDFVAHDKILDEYYHAGVQWTKRDDK